MLDVAIICSSIPAREHLLRRSMFTWRQSAETAGFKWAIRVYREREDIENKIWEYPLGTEGNIHQADAPISGSHIAGYNYWLERLKAKVYIFTHPDLLFPLETVRTAFDIASKDNVAAMFKVFWIPQGMTEEIDKYPWRTPEKLEDEMALYPLYSNEHGDFYWNKDVRDKTEWHSTTTWAINHATLQKLRPFEDFHEQGADDAWFFGMRSRLMIEDVCVMNPILFHQWHPQTWNGDSHRAVKLATLALNKRFK